MSRLKGASSARTITRRGAADAFLNALTASFRLAHLVTSSSNADASSAERFGWGFGAELMGREVRGLHLSEIISLGVLLARPTPHPNSRVMRHK